MRHTKSLKRISRGFISVATVFTVLFSGVAPSQASVVAPQAWTAYGLNEVARYVGKYQVSTDGFRSDTVTSSTGSGATLVTTTSGNLSIAMPTDATANGENVVAAFLTSASSLNSNTFGPPPTTLNSAAVTYDYSSTVPSRLNASYANYMSDVTSIVRTFMNGKTAGTHNIPVSYILNDASKETNIYAPTYSSGLALTVVFENPTLASDTSVVMLFGQANATLQKTEISFPALASSVTGSTLSLGVAWSTGGSEVSTVRVSNQVTPSTFTTISNTAGGDDDDYNPSSDFGGGFLTVGGVGDSTSNTDATDDELYNLDSFLVQGTQKITVETSNTSNNDNFFQAVLFLPFTLNASGVNVYSTTFDTQGGSAVTAGTYTTGSTITLPAAPTRSGYTFAGWFTASTGGTALGSTYTPSGTGDISIFAQWTQNATPALTPVVASQPAAVPAVASVSLADSVALARTGAESSLVWILFGFTTLLGLALVATSLRLRRKGFNS